MLQLSADLSVLSTSQRKAVADFIIAFPHSTPEHNEEFVSIPAFTTADEDDDSPAPEQAFTAISSNLGPMPVPIPVDNDRLDKAGLPWDDRIHASSRVKTADGCWRKRRGIDDATVATVEGQLKALMGIPAPVAAVPPPPPNPTSAVDSTFPAPVAAANVVPTAIASAPPAPTTDRNAFVHLITRAGEAIAAKKLTQEQFTAAVKAIGVESIPLLANRLDLVPQVSVILDSYLASAQQ